MGCPEQVRGGVAVEETTRVACRPPKQFASHRPGDDRGRVSPTQLQREHETAPSFSSSRHEPRDAGSTPTANSPKSHLCDRTLHHDQFFFFSLSRKKRKEKRRNRRKKNSQAADGYHTLNRSLSHLDGKARSVLRRRQYRTAHVGPRRQFPFAWGHLHAALALNWQEHTHAHTHTHARQRQRRTTSERGEKKPA